MELLTLYVGQGALSVVRAADEAVIVDSHMPNCDDVTQEQIELGIAEFVKERAVRGLVLTGLDRDHACPAGVDSILSKQQPDWVMYPKYYKDTDAASEVFETIEWHRTRRENTGRPLRRYSVRVDILEVRLLLGLANAFSFELFSPHIDDMDCSNNSSIVLKLSGLDTRGFSYLVTGDTESDRWDAINRYFGEHLKSDVLAAPHHGSRSGVNAESLLLISPDTVLISAGVDNCYEHPDGVAVEAYGSIANHVHATNADDEGANLFTRRRGEGFETVAVQIASGAGARL